VACASTWVEALQYVILLPLASQKNLKVDITVNKTHRHRFINKNTLVDITVNTRHRLRFINKNTLVDIIVNTRHRLRFINKNTLVDITVNTRHRLRFINKNTLASYTYLPDRLMTSIGPEELTPMVEFGKSTNIIISQKCLKCIEFWQLLLSRSLRFV